MKTGTLNPELLHQKVLMVGSSIGSRRIEQFQGAMERGAFEIITHQGFGGRVVGVATADKMTGPQRVAKVRQYYQ